MKNIRKRIIALISVLAVAVTGLAGCSKDKQDQNSLKETEKYYPLQFGDEEHGLDIEVGDTTLNLNSPDPVADPTEEAAAQEPATEEVVEDVTDASGAPVTEVVYVTEPSGEQATDAAGAVVTEIAKVTQIVVKPVENPSTSTQPVEQTTNDSGYVAAEKGRFAMWLDISGDVNKFFEDEMLKITFKVKDTAPDGDYTLRLDPQYSDIAGVSVKPSKVANGTIRVNKGTIEAQDMSAETGERILYADNVACKQGDTVDCYINIKNNTGLAAFFIWFYFDTNALEFVDACAAGEFEEIAKQTEIGAKDVDAK
ncbi:MAG: hypothetical protein J6K77_06460 [Ruminococcus sp.]|nr:hypothetical protein [Ruminococcus sp.]